MDIIICTYNNAQLLDRTLMAIARQQVSSQHPWSVLVVDNNCTDDTALVVEQHRRAQTIPGLRRVVERQQGLTYARLCGVNQTSSEWIAFVDDDCLLTETWIEQAITFAATHPQCGAFGGKVILDWEIPPSPTLVKHARSFAALDRGDAMQQLSRQNFHIPGAGIVMQRKALEQCGWLKRQGLTGRNGNKLTAGDDSEIVLRILNAGYELWYTPTCVLHHFITAHRISEKYLAKMSYGFGAAAPYIARLSWNRSYGGWLVISMLRVMKCLVVTLKCAISSLWKADRWAEVLIEWNWTRGQMEGLWTLLAMSQQEGSCGLNTLE